MRQLFFAISRYCSVRYGKGGGGEDVIWGNQGERFQISVRWSLNPLVCIHILHHQCGTFVVGCAGVGVTTPECGSHALSPSWLVSGYIIKPLSAHAMSVTATDREASAMTFLCQGSINWTDGMLISSDFSDEQRDAQLGRVHR